MLLTNLRRQLFKGVASESLAVYRILFGGLMAVGTLRYWAMGWIERSFIEPQFFFKYWGFSWVPTPSPEVIYLLFALLFISSTFIALGLFTRIAGLVFFVLFSWVELMDASNYLNHYYLVSILAFINLFLPLGKRWSLDVLLKRTSELTEIPAWCIYVLRTQLSIVYFYAGLAKATGDWLFHAQPMNIWMTANIDLPFIGPLFGYEWAHFGAAWAGFLYDLLIWIFLWIPRTRKFAYVVVIVFHTTTHLMFPIGLFPFIMTLCTLIFFAPDWPSRVWFWFRRAPHSRMKISSVPQVTPDGKIFVLATFLVFQLLFPLRWLFYPNHILWSEEGGRWAWKVMTREKNGDVEFKVIDKITNETFTVYPSQYLHKHQELEMSGQPDLVLQLAHKIGAEFKKEGREVAVFASAWVSLNGRPSRQWLDSQVDLMSVTDDWSSKNWVLPFPQDPPPRQKVVY